MDIITVRMHGEADNSPLEMISARRLAHLKRVEAAAKAFLHALGSSDSGGAPESVPAQPALDGAPSAMPTAG